MPEQHQLHQLKSDNVWNHIQDGGHVYLCGGAHTSGAAIESAWLDIFQEQGRMVLDDALKYLRDHVSSEQIKRQHL